MTLTLAPAIAQQSGEEIPDAYVELMTSLTSANRYVRYVDGDAETPDPQQSFTSLVPLTFGNDPELLTVAASADPGVKLAGTGCLNAAGEPIGPLPGVSPAQTIYPPVAWIGPLPVIGVTSYTCTTGAVPSIIPEDTNASIRPGETLTFARGADLPLDFRALKLSINADSTTTVRATAKLDGAVVGTIDVDLAVDCVNTSEWFTSEALCATRVVPFFGALPRQRYLNLDFGEPFDSFDLTVTAGEARLKGMHPSRFFLNGQSFGGTIGGETGESSISEPPTDTLPGYETTCTDAADPPPEGPCGGKEVDLTISRFLADVDDDGDDEQVLNVVPSGSAEEVAFLTIIVRWAAEAPPAGALPLSGVDEDGDGPDDNDPAPWCSVDPPGPPGDEWCLATFTTASAGSGLIQVTETYQGTGDPKFTR